MTARLSVARRIVITCPTCGHQGNYATPALATLHFGRHSCATNLERAARRARRIAREQDPGQPAECPHGGRHQHGTRTAYIVDRCRCRACRDAVAAAERQRTRNRLYGRPTRLVDAQPARDHLARLAANGMGWKRVATAAGLNWSTVSAIIYGRRGTDPRPPRRQIGRKVADAILAVKFDVADGARVDATGTQRRLQALVAIGWPQASLAVELDMTPTNLSRIINTTLQVTAGTARRTRALYDRLWNKPGPSDLARRHATERGWLAPLWWDDDTIDQADAEPATPGPKRTKQDETAELLEDLLDVAPGMRRPDAAHRLGLTLAALEQRLHRAGRSDLLARVPRNPRPDAALHRAAS